MTFGVLVIALAVWGGWRATKSGAISLPVRDRRQRLPDGPPMREFQLGSPTRGTGGEMSGGGSRDSASSGSASLSSISTGYSGSSRRYTGGVGGGHGASTSVDLRASEASNSWWRWSSTSAANQGSSSLGHSDLRENGHRRVSVLRTSNGQIDSSLIGRPQVLSNSLMID